MPKRICWEKGIKLTDSLFRLSDDFRDELSGTAFSMMTAGRFGLIPSGHPFHITLNFTKNYLEVTEIRCTAVTGGGFLIDLSYDTVFSRICDAVVPLPEESGEYYLLLNVRKGEWVRTNAQTCEPVYFFSLISANTPVPDQAVPVAHIVDAYGWRMDDVDFLPPCIFLSSDRKYVELRERTAESVSIMESRLSEMATSECRTAVMMMWPVIQQVRISLTMDVEFMTPMILLGCLQKCVGAFYSACMIDDHIMLENVERYVDFIKMPYDFRNVYVKIKEGIGWCEMINDRIHKFGEVEKAPEVPVRRRKVWSGYVI